MAPLRTCYLLYVQGGQPMFEEQFSILFQTVAAILNKLATTDATEQLHLRNQLSEIHDLGVSWLDQWMALEEQLTDAYDKLDKIKTYDSRTSRDQTIKESTTASTGMNLKRQVTTPESLQVQTSM
jgi:hypothetical protein